MSLPPNSSINIIISPAGKRLYSEAKKKEGKGGEKGGEKQETSKATIILM
jgi:hypothetical protein